jgi:hypothetical protein
MSVKSNEEVIPIPDKFVEEHITNMMQYQFGKSRSRAEEIKLLKSENKSLKSKLLASVKGTKKEEKAQKEDAQDNMKWCWFYDRNYCLDFAERSVEEKLDTANTLFLPDKSVQLQLKVWNSLYLYIKASPEEVEEVNNIIA